MINWKPQSLFCGELLVIVPEDRTINSNLRPKIAFTFCNVRYRDSELLLLSITLFVIVDIPLDQQALQATQRQIRLVAQFLIVLKPQAG